MIERVLGIDLASSTWSNNGSAIITFDRETNAFASVVAPAIAWPVALPLSPATMADAIDAFARREGIRAVSMDGPQGWRDPSTDPALPGVGRRCEYDAQTPGRTGAYPQTYPAAYFGWTNFCVEVFAELLTRPGVTLAEQITPTIPPGGYAILECFPTSTWRSSGLQQLPGKGKNPVLAPFIANLSAAYGLPPFALGSHDDLQAVVAALAAVGVLNGPAVAVRHGIASTVVTPHAV